MCRSMQHPFAGVICWHVQAGAMLVYFGGKLVVHETPWRTKGRIVQTQAKIVQVAHIFLFRSCGEKIGSPKHKSRFPFWCLLPSAVHKISTQVLILVSWGPEARCLRLHVAQRGPQQGRNRKNMFKSWPFTVGTCLPFWSCRGNKGYANSCNLGVLLSFPWCVDSCKQLLS